MSITIDNIVGGCGYAGSIKWVWSRSSQHSADRSTTTSTPSTQPGEGEWEEEEGLVGLGGSRWTSGSPMTSPGEVMLPWQRELSGAYRKCGWGAN